MEFFVDSSIIIETLKGNEKAVNIFNILEKIDKLDLFINQTVVSESVFQLTYKRKFLIDEIKEIFDNFYFLRDNESIIELAFYLMNRYNLKPNDALILATCKQYNISYLISLDSDFKEPCKKEGIILIDSVEKLKGF